MNLFAIEIQQCLEGLPLQVVFSIDLDLVQFDYSFSVLAQ